MREKLKYRFTNAFSRTRTVFTDGSLNILQAELSRDRVRRVYYDQIAFVLTSKHNRILGLIVLFLALFAFALATLLNIVVYKHFIVASITGTTSLFMVLGLITTARNKMRYIAIYRAGSIHRISGAMGQKKFDRFMESLTQRINAAQRAGQPSVAATKATPNMPPASMEPSATVPVPVIASSMAADVLPTGPTAESPPGADSETSDPVIS